MVDTVQVPRDVLDALQYYGRIHTVEGVRYGHYSHGEALKVAEAALLGTEPLKSGGEFRAVPYGERWTDVPGTESQDIAYVHDSDGRAICTVYRDGSMAIAQRIADALNRAKSVPERWHGWQPIETGPRTGVAVLLLRPWRSGFNRVVIGHYANGWVIGEEFICPIKPTHWQPLPQALPEPSESSNRRTVEHVCGLAGYNGMIDPPCPGCAESRGKHGFKCDACGHTTTDAAEGAPCNSAVHPPCVGRLRAAEK